MEFVVNGLELEALEEDFREAVEFTGRKGKKLGEDVQRLLFGLHCVAARGGPPEGEAPPQEHDERERHDAWTEAASVVGGDRAAAKREYVDVVIRNCPKFQAVEPTDDEAGDEAPDMDQLQSIKDQLAAAGLTERGAAAAAGAAVDVFEAARFGALEALAEFLPEGATACDADGVPALVHAVDAEQHDAAELLLDAGADVNALDADGSSAMHYAALLGAEGLVELLLERGADASLTDEDGHTPGEVAADEGHHGLAELLRLKTSYGAQRDEDPGAVKDKLTSDGRKLPPEVGRAGTTLPRHLLEKVPAAK